MCCSRNGLFTRINSWLGLRSLDPLRASLQPPFLRASPLSSSFPSFRAWRTCRTWRKRNVLTPNLLSHPYCQHFSSFSLMKIAWRDRYFQRILTKKNVRILGKTFFNFLQSILHFRASLGDLHERCKKVRLPRLAKKPVLPCLCVSSLSMYWWLLIFYWYIFNVCFVGVL